MAGSHKNEIKSMNDKKHGATWVLTKFPALRPRPQEVNGDDGQDPKHAPRVSRLLLEKQKIHFNPSSSVCIAYTV